MSRKAGNRYYDYDDYDDYDEYYDEDGYDDYDYDNYKKPKGQTNKQPNKQPQKKVNQPVKSITKQVGNIALTPNKQGKSTPNKNAVSSADKNKAFMEEYKKSCVNDKPELSMVVVGHVDAGKSTLMGHLLLQCGQVTKDQMRKFEQESQKMNKSSFKFAWVMDSGDEERKRGITMDIAHSTFETDKYKVNIMDAPGHRDFVPNMISGTSQADVALLVVASQQGEFESGFNKKGKGSHTGGQTREHLSIVRSLGISQLVVAVNKLDCVGYDQSRFDEIVGKLKVYIEQDCGFHSNNVKYVPVSGLLGNNIVKRCDSIDNWYTGTTLVKAIDEFKAPSRNLDHPFRFIVSNVYKPANISGLCLDGKVIAGGVMSNSKIQIMPSNEDGLVKKIEVDGISRKVAVSGQQCTLVVTGVKNEDGQVRSGCVVCVYKQVCQVSSLVKARVIVMDTKVPLTMGTRLQFHYNTLNIPATIVKLKCKIHKDTGVIGEKNPKNIGKNDGAAIRLKLHSKVCVELYENLMQMGRFTLRYSNETVARGIITKIYDDKESR